MKDEAGVLLREGRLADAIESASAAVRADPIALGGRVLLAELLLLGGQLERADAVLEATGELDPSAAIPIAEFRQLLRAAMIRRLVLTDDRIPEFPGAPTVAQRSALRALVELRAGDFVAAAASTRAAEAARPAVSGAANGTGFDDFRDADDVLSGSLELLTVTGRYFWMPIEQVVSLEFEPPRHPRDLAWRCCKVLLRDGSEAKVIIPALYEHHISTCDALRLGRETDWTQTEPVRGSGQRVFLAGEEGLPVQQLVTVEFA
jgi:type VI secretion system protein ImpE